MANSGNRLMPLAVALAASAAFHLVLVVALHLMDLISLTSQMEGEAVASVRSSKIYLVALCEDVVQEALVSNSRVSLRLVSA